MDEETNTDVENKTGTLEDLDPKDTETKAEVPDFDIDAFKRFADTNPDAKAWIQQSTQAKIDKGVQSMFENKKEELEQEALLKASNLTPEQKEIAQIKQEMAKMKNEKAIADNKALVLQELNEYEIDSSVKPYLQSFALDLVDVDPNKTTGMLQNLTTIIDKMVESSQRSTTFDNVSRLSETREQSQPSQTQQAPSQYVDPNTQGREAIARAMFGGN